MRKLFSLIIIGLVCSLNAEAKKIEGKIILDHDTIDVIFNIPFKFFAQEPNYEKLQYKVKFYDSTGKRGVIRPDHAKEIRFKLYGKDIRMLSRHQSSGMGNVFSTNYKLFLKLEIDGKLQLFNYYQTNSSPGMYNAGTGMMSGGHSYTTERYVLQKENGELKRPRGLTFKKDMVNYFQDCPELAQKIENKEFRKADMESLVHYYNSNCGR